nr:glycoside hydrolase family 88 protein [uncultured Pedobacter sp.]
MNKYIKKPIILLIFCASVFSCKAQNINYKRIIKHAENQTDIMIKEISEIRKAGKSNLVSPRTLQNNEVKLVSSEDWTSGFFPGSLWYLYDLTGEDKWKTQAEKFTNFIEKEKLNGSNHDIGFKVYCSFGNGYRATQNETYKSIIIQAAKTLMTRFNPKTGVIRSWDHHQDKWKNPVIIDNMINLELLFEATKITGDSSFYRAAVSHANNTMKNHFRPDYSSYHVVDYAPETGAVLKKNTHQGYSDGSAWARGQAWALYGFTMCYRFTKNPLYLKQAENVAKFILTHPNMPKDLIPFWDFNAPNIPNEPRDASAASVIASGLLELSQYSNNKQNYLSKAKQILYNLSKKYTTKKGEAKGFILLHSTGSKPSNSEVDVPLSYADYYYLEALFRLKSFNL